MFDFFVKSKKHTKSANNDGGERQETSSSTSSLTDCPSDNTAEDKSIQISMKKKHRLHQISPAPAERKTEKQPFKKIWLRDYKWLKFQEDNNSMSCTVSALSIRCQMHMLILQVITFDKGSVNM